MIENTSKSVLNDAGKRSRNATFSAVHITKIPRRRSLKNQHRRQSIKSIRSIGSNNVSLRPTTNIVVVYNKSADEHEKKNSMDNNSYHDQTESKEISLNEEAIISKKAITQSASISKINPNKWDNDNSNKKSPIENIDNDHGYNYNILSTVRKQSSQPAKLVNFKNIICNIHNGLTYPYDTPSNRMIYTNENDHNLNSKRRRTRKSLNNCSRPCLCIFISLLIALIIGIIAAATAVTLSKIQKITITTTITTTTTDTTTTTTDTTSTSTTSTTESTTTPYSCGNMTILLNTDILGFDFASTGSTQWTACCALCLGNSTCQSFTLDVPSSACYLKVTPTNNGSYSSTHMSAKY
ncbi:unnamed protein product [Adineta steineri]|uniref:Apple domain-containing protein n=2 Tax=Adineta steineri TaxID=433720 RepID=A0A819DBE4_9BILA|nr:unnamed protein product [Adineta steineri]